MGGMQVILILVVAGLTWTAFWLWVIMAPRSAPGDASAGSGLARLRRVLLPVLVAVGVVAFVASLRGLPYPVVRASVLGPPQVTVNVAAEQWAWTFSQTTLPAAVPIEFVVTSRDVNHGFAIYSPDNQLLAQVQAMPGYTNRLIYTFGQPGSYTIRCLEYCGVPHYAMVTTLTVR